MFDQNKKTTKGFKLVLVLVLILVVFCLYYFFNKNKAVEDNVYDVSTTTSDNLYNRDTVTNTTNSDENIINDVVFKCADNKNIHAVFLKNSTVEINLSDGRDFTLLQGMSASGARYVNRDESFVFWNKGNTAFVQEQGEDTFKDCVIK